MDLHENKTDGQKEYKDINDNDIKVDLNDKSTVGAKDQSLNIKI